MQLLLITSLLFENLWDLVLVKWVFNLKNWYARAVVIVTVDICLDPVWEAEPSQATDETIPAEHVITERNEG